MTDSQRTPPTDTSPDESEPPARYDCLCCDERYLTGDELHRHVTAEHTTDDVAISLAPLNIPTIARFQDDPEITTEREARVAVKKEGRDGTAPEATRQLADGVCPVCGEQAIRDSDVPVRMVPPHGHSVWEWYQTLREVVPEQYEQSPTFDTAGYPEPAGTVMEVVPGDELTITVEEWDGPATAVVSSLTDPRAKLMPADWEEREVTITLTDNAPGEPPYSARLEPSSDGSVRINRRRRTPGPAVIADVTAISREPWYR